MWQIETGPALSPKLGDVSAMTYEALTNLLPYFVFAINSTAQSFFLISLLFKAQLSGPVMRQHPIFAAR